MGLALKDIVLDLEMLHYMLSYGGIRYPSETMRNPFRTWLLEQTIDEEAMSQFEESLLCYQVGACRAALIFSFLGLIRTISYRLMIGTKPASLPARMWETIQAQLRDDSKWESAAYDAALRTQPESILLIDDDIRDQLRYWRGRRNDAAHSRGNEISFPHVESLWLFIRSNLSKLVVNGGREGLLVRFQKHVDPSYTPPDASFADLVHEIPQAVRPQDYGSFLSEVFGVLGIDNHASLRGEIGDKGCELVDHIVNLNDRRLIEAFRLLVQQTDARLVGTLLRRPAFVLQISFSPSDLRRLWHDLLPFYNFHEPRAARNQSLRVFSALLRNGLIPETEQDAAMKHVVEKLWDDDPPKSYPDDLIEELVPFKFLDAVYSHIVDYDRLWLKGNVLLLEEYLLRRPLTRELAEIIESLFTPRNLNPAEPEGIEYLQRLQHFLSHNYDLFDDIVRFAREQSISTVHFERAMKEGM